MIRLEKIGKQNGRQIVFIEASAALQRGEKVGLVGPNGAGKTTLFRMITGEEQPDEGQVAADRGITIGYFSQDVGEMSGRTVVSEVMNGAGPVSEIGAELKEIEQGLADPDRADEMEALIERYGEVQARFEELDGYALEGRAYEVLAGLSFSQEMMDGDVGKLSGGWKMRVALARILLMNPDVMLLDEPSNHLDLESLIWLEDFLKGYEGALLMTSHDREFMNRIVTKIVEIDGLDAQALGREQDALDAAGPGARQVAGDAADLLRAAPGDQRDAAAGAVRAPAGDAGERDQVH
jgi:ATPase subunit of ABC transporter with duplicated ATPase domains